MELFRDSLLKNAKKSYGSAMRCPVHERSRLIKLSKRLKSLEQSGACRVILAGNNRGAGVRSESYKNANVTGE